MKANFPIKLYDTANDSSNAGKLCFDKSGTVLTIFREGRSSEFLREHFGITSYATLTRSLNYYGFKNVNNSAKAEVKVYSNPNFTTRNPDASRSIKRKPRAAMIFRQKATSSTLVVPQSMTLEDVSISELESQEFQSALDEFFYQ